MSIYQFPQSSSGGGTWGSITGTLSSQTDLQTALNLKAPLASPTFTGDVLESTTLGSELAPALTAGNWTVGSGWESPIVGPGLIKNANGTGTQTPSAATTIVSGTLYKVVVTVINWSVGSFTYTVGGVTVVSAPAANGTYTDYVTAQSTGKLIITPTNTSRLTISVVSIKAVTSTGGTFTAEGNLLFASPGNWASSQTMNNGVYWKTTSTLGAVSRMLGIDTGNLLHVGTPGNGESPLAVWIHGSNNATSGLKADLAGVVGLNGAMTSVGNATLKWALGGANIVTTDTLNIASLGAANNTTVSIDAGGADISSSPMFSLTLNDRTTKTYKIARDGYLLAYNNTTTAGVGSPFIPNVVALTAQSASITTTNIRPTIAGAAGVPPAGVYRVIVEMFLTTAGTSGTVACTIGWSDPGAARTASPASTLTFGTLVRSSGSIEFTCDGIAELTYLTTVTAAVGSPVYTLKITLERLQ